MEQKGATGMSLGPTYSPFRLKESRIINAIALTPILQT